MVLPTDDSATGSWMTVDRPAHQPFDLGHHLVPLAGQRGLACLRTPGTRLLRVAGQLRRQRHEAVGIAQPRQQAVLAAADQLAGRSVRESQHRQAAGHGLGRDVAEGLGHAGEDEGIGRGVVRGQVLAGAHAGKQRLRAARLQVGTHRAVAHQQQAAVGPHLAHGVVGAHQQAEVLLRCQPAHMGHHLGAFAHAPGRPQCAAAVPGVVAGGVHATGHHAHVVEAVAQQLALQQGRGHHGGLCGVVEAAQVGHDGPLQPADAVVLAVGVEVGAEVRGHPAAPGAGRPAAPTTPAAPRWRCAPHPAGLPASAHPTHRWRAGPSSAAGSAGSAGRGPAVPAGPHHRRRAPGHAGAAAPAAAGAHAGAGPGPAAPPSWPHR